MVGKIIVKSVPMSNEERIADALAGAKEVKEKLEKLLSDVKWIISALETGDK